MTPAPTPPPPAIPQRPEMEKMTVPELKALAAKHGLAHDLKATKAILLDLLDKRPP